jgi:hypothetical protein
MMTPTNDQIFREAVRRREAVPIEQRLPVQDYVIEVVRENWTPPEPVDPDILAFREWGAADSEADGWTGGATLHRQGHFDLSEGAQAYLAGARMAREQFAPREREMLSVLEEFSRDCDGYLDGDGHPWALLQRARDIIAKHKEKRDD